MKDLSAAMVGWPMLRSIGASFVHLSVGEVRESLREGKDDDSTLRRKKHCRGRAQSVRSGSAACVFAMSFSLDLVRHGLYNPATSRQAVSFFTSERTTISALGLCQDETAPTSTNVAQTLSALARQCQDIIGLKSKGSRGQSRMHDPGQSQVKTWRTNRGPLWRPALSIQ